MSKNVEVAIKGVSPLLMHRYPMVPVDGIDKKSAADQAEVSAYRREDNKGLYVPSECILRALISGATFSKGKGRATLQKVICAAVFVGPNYIDLGTDKYAIDSRTVVIPATKGRIVRHRPRLDEWACKFNLQFDDTLLDEKQMRKVVDDTGSRIGILEFRPEKKGPFGRFVVTSWS